MKYEKSSYTELRSLKSEIIIESHRQTFVLTSAELAYWPAKNITVRLGCMALERISLTPAPARITLFSQSKPLNSKILLFSSAIFRAALPRLCPDADATHGHNAAQSQDYG
jgi:hypothetical protein